MCKRRHIDMIKTCVPRVNWFTSQLAISNSISLYLSFSFFYAHMGKF